MQWKSEKTCYNISIGNNKKEEPMKTGLQFEMTNTCTCTVQDEATGEWTDEPTEECYGDCWEWAVEDFAMLTEALFDNNETYWWKVTNLALWSGNVSGYFHAKNVNDLINGMTVNSAWTMRGTVYDDRIEYSLSHHDAMGSATTLTPISEEEREELGLY